MGAKVLEKLFFLSERVIDEVVCLLQICVMSSWRILRHDLIQSVPLALRQAHSFILDQMVELKVTECRASFEGFGDLLAIDTVAKVPDQIILSGHEHVKAERQLEWLLLEALEHCGATGLACLGGH